MISQGKRPFYTRSGLFPVVGLYFLLCSSCDKPGGSAAGELFYNPIEYNDYIVDRQNQINWAVIQLNRAYDSGEQKQIRNRYDSLLQCTRHVSIEFSELTSYAGDSSLQEEARSIVFWYDKIFRKEYKEMIEIYLKGAGASDKDIGRFVEISRKVSVEEEERIRELEAAQVKFSEKFGFEFAPGSLPSIH